MTTPFPFVAGQVLTAAQLNDIQNLPISDKTASYVLIAGDETKRTIMNNASATTITVNNSIFTVGDVIQVANKGAGTCTITAGTGVTINTLSTLALAQYGGGYLLALSASTFTFFNLGGTATINVDFLVIGGGGSGGLSIEQGAGGAGGLRTSTGTSGGGASAEPTLVLSKATNYAVVIGAGAAAGAVIGSSSSFLNVVSYGGGGGGGGANADTAASRGFTGGSSGGSRGVNGTPTASTPGLTNQGFGGGTGTSDGATYRSFGGGGGAGGAGGNGSASAPAVNGAGGAGLANSISGTSVTYAAGASVATGAGTANTGNASGANAAGGSGIVILRYADTLTITIGAGLTGTESAPSGGYKRATITAGSGNVSWA